MLRLLGLLLTSLHACTGDVHEPMINLDMENFPGRHARRLHLVMFYSPDCAHCETVQPYLLHIAEALQGERDIVVGAIDCTNTSNYGVCRQHNITGYPSIFAIGWRHLAQYSGGASESLIRSWFDKLRRRRSSRSSGGSAACPPGLFARHKSVIPLCAEHYPDETAKHPWLVVLYKMQHEIEEPVLAVAKDLGGRRKQRERLRSLAHRYNLEVNEAHAAAQNLDTSEAFAKVGVLCCDCGPEERAFCKDLQSRWRARRLPLALWVFKEEQVLHKGMVSAPDLILFVLSRLGLVASRHGGRSEL